MCDSADAYVHKLGYLQLGCDEPSTEHSHGRVSSGSRPEAQVPVVPRGSHLQHHTTRDSTRSARSLGGGESFGDGNSGSTGPEIPLPGGRQGALPAPPDYKMYERENMIGASRFVPSKSGESINSAMGQYHHNLQHQSRSQQQQQAPVYENIEYYPQQQAPPYYHPIDVRKSPRGSPRGSVSGDTYEATFRKAQPQVPSGNRYQSSSPAKELPPYEAPPVYENIQEVGHFENEPPQQNKAAPQVPNYYHPANLNGGDYVVMTGKVY